MLGRPQQADAAQRRDEAEELAVPTGRSAKRKEAADASPPAEEWEPDESLDREVAAELERTLRRVGQLDSAQEGLAWVIDEPEGRFRLAARWRGASPGGGVRVAPQGAKVGRDEAPLLARAAVRGRLQSMRDLDRIDPRRLALRSSAADGRVSLLPVVAGGGAVAVLLLFAPGGDAPDYRVRRSMETTVRPLGQMLLRQRSERRFAIERSRFEAIVAARAEQARRLDARLHESERWAMVGGFAAGLLHDLTNTLLPMQCGLEILASEPLGTVARSQVEAMATSHGQLQRLVRDLRDLAGGGAQRGGRTSVRAWWRRERRGLLKRFPEGVAFASRISTEVAAAAISPSRLRMILAQLLDNALRAVGAAGAVSLRVDAEPDEGMVRFEVADDGAGMSEAIRRRATEPFFTTRPRQFGTGLGLSLVRSLLEASGGSIEIDSVPGRGTRVVVRVPIAAAAPVRSGVMAVVAVADPRLAGLLEHVLRRRGATLVERLPKEGGWLLVVDGRESDFKQVRDLVGARRGGEVLVVGQLPEEPAGEAWKDAPPMRSVDATDVVAVKNRLEAMFDQLSGG